MAGIIGLDEILSTLEPQLMDGEFVFCTFKDAVYGDYAGLNPLCSYREAEGLTLIIERDIADNADIQYTSIYKLLTLKVHSSLDAVGLTAAVTTTLSNHNISGNVVAAYFRDHVFVPSDKAFEAIEVLKNIQGKNKKIN